MKIACHLLQLSPGDRIPTVSEYCALLGTGSGTLQAALHTLIEAGAVTLESRGHQGTYIVAMERSSLWRYGFSNVFFGSMPLPYTGRLLGLATALYEQFERVGIPFGLAYVRGSRWRIKRLLGKRTDFVVCSQLSANLAQKEYGGIMPVLKLGEETYDGQIVQVFSDSSCREVCDGMRIGIDDSSYDQEAITRMACHDKDATFISLNYTEIFSKLRKGVIDVIYWNMDEIKEKHPDLVTVPISGVDLEQGIREMTQAVIVTSEDNNQYIPLIREVLDLNQIHQVQKDVMECRRVPSY